jgi:predicted glycoside hydrolase/deacetylase ChbG (UPF0249 family)
VNARRIWLCADDYGLAPGVSDAIRQVIARGRLNATSVMVLSPHFNAGEAQALLALEPRAALGLHVTLTGPFAPISEGFSPLEAGRFPMLKETMRLAFMRRLRLEKLKAEIAAQLRAFRSAFGRAPDFVDGHQHVHLLPQVRDAFLDTVAQAAPGAWVRQCGRARHARRLRERKALVLDLLSVAFRAKARRRGLAANPAFVGAYEFTGRTDFAAIFPRFLTGLPDGGLIMCHPGFVDAELERLDPLTTLREAEFAYLNSDAFPQALAAHGLALAQPGE